ncbi:hypothetical protein SCALIN_C39_0002, partial [Candidatus Scalindua japonica]
NLALIPDVLAISKSRVTAENYFVKKKIVWKRYT